MSKRYTKINLRPFLDVLILNYLMENLHVYRVVLKYFFSLGREDLESKIHRQLVEGKGSSSLTIAPITYDDAGVYECVADNGIQPIIKSNFTLTIRGRDKCFTIDVSTEIESGYFIPVI